MCLWYSSIRVLRFVKAHWKIWGKGTNLGESIAINSTWLFAPHVCKDMFTHLNLLAKPVLVQSGSKQRDPTCPYCSNMRQRRDHCTARSELARIPHPTWSRRKPASHQRADGDRWRSLVWQGLMAEQAKRWTCSGTRERRKH